MFSSTLTASLAVLAIFAHNPGYETRMEELMGQRYDRAIEVLGAPEARDLRAGGGEVWTFRDGPLVSRPAPTSTISVSRPANSLIPRSDVVARPWICTTRIAIEPDGTIAGYAYTGRCLAP